jgi:hypothetical protein
MKTITKILVILFCVLNTGLIAQNIQRSSQITKEEIIQHIKYLSSDELRGRRTGEEGNRVAANYIAKEFEQYGLKPVGDGGGYFQSFPFLQEVKPGEKNALSIHSHSSTMKLIVKEDFMPMSFSRDTSVQAPMVFIGYGIAGDSLGYNDYTGVDVKNKIVVALRYTPEGDRPESKFFKYASLMVKAFTARERGASGIIFVMGPSDEEVPKLMSFKYPDMADAGIAIMTLKWNILDSLFHLQGKDLRTVQKDILANKKPQSFPIEQTEATMQASILKVYGTSANIVGFLEGNDAKLKNEILVIGAHMDHLGMGGQGSLAPDTVAIHHGADDNASGTSGMLELAQYLSVQKSQLRRSVLFTAYSGEELGLFGSSYYVNHPLFPLDRTIAMINMDMIGRMKESTLVVEGMGTSPNWEPLMKQENSDSLKLKFKPDGFGPSDQSSFYGKDIPVLFFFTNLHDDYHRPSDTWDKINAEGEQKVVRLAGRVAMDIINDPQKPAFTKVVTSSNMGPGGDRQGVRVSLGVIPDYAEDAAGLKISGSRPGSAAEKAGLKGGDIITKFGGKTVKNIYDFTYMLGEYKPGDKVIIVVKRGSEEVSLEAILEARK